MPSEAATAGSAISSPASSGLVEQVARTIGRAGYANAIWPVDAAREILPPAYVYVPSELSTSHRERFARRRPSARPRAMASGLATEVRQALGGDLILGSAPGPGWLAGLPSHARDTIRCALLTSQSLVTAYVALRVEDRAFGVLGVAGHRLTDGDLATLSIVTSELALRLQGSRSQYGAASVQMVDRLYAQRLLEEITQPLTALVARAEVMHDLIRENKIDDVVDQLQAMRASAQRLAGWTDVTARMLKPDFEDPPQR